MPQQPHLAFGASVPGDATLSAVLQVAERLEAVVRDVAVLKQEIHRQRCAIKDGVKRQHIAAAGGLGGWCPCCGSAEVVDQQGRKAIGAEFDQLLRGVET